MFPFSIKLKNLAIVCVLAASCIPQWLHAQNVGIGTATPAASAQLDVTSITKGMLVPRVTTAQMNAIASPAAGLLVYNTDSAAFAYRDASGWLYLRGTANKANGWSTLGNSETDPATNFIGTIDNKPVVVRQNDERAGLLAGLNTSWGARALNPSSTGLGNTANGASTLYKNTTGAYNTANGIFALYSNTTGKSNTASGEGALSNNTIGNFNTAYGVHALINNTTGFSNVAIGIEALSNNTTSSNLVAVGDSALYNNGEGGTSIEHGLANTAVGSKALFTNTLGFHNTAIGLNALFSNTSGWRNTAHGVDALFSNTTGNNNTALGFEAGFNNQSGHGNVFLGRRAGGQETGSNKLYINNEIGDAGNALLYGEFDTDKLRINNKLGIGRLPASFPLEIQALSAGTNDLLKFFNATGTERWHLNLLSNGSLNFVESNVADNRLVLGAGGEVGVGKVPLTASTDSRLVVKQKGSQNGIGIEAANSSNHWDFYTTLEVSSSLSLYYNGAIKGTFAAANGAYTQASDRRLKKDITRYQPVLDKLNQLEAFSYHYADNDSNAPLSTGFMAQDVQKLFPEAVSEMDMKNGEKMLGINYQYFTVAAIKGLQEQQAKIETLEERITKLEAMVNRLVERKN